MLSERGGGLATLVETGRDEETRSGRASRGNSRLALPAFHLLPPPPPAPAAAAALRGPRDKSRTGGKCAITCRRSPEPRGSPAEEAWLLVGTPVRERRRRLEEFGNQTSLSLLLQIAGLYLRGTTWRWHFGHSCRAKGTLYQATFLGGSGDIGLAFPLSCLGRWAMAGSGQLAFLLTVSLQSFLQPALGQGPPDNTTVVPTSSTSHYVLSGSELAAAIAVPCVFGGLILIGLLVFMGLKIREKRQTEGTYRPSNEEQAGARVETSTNLKLPPEERLI
nr:protein crumbs homolog 3 [Pogona vitticeps]